MPWKYPVGEQQVQTQNYRDPDVFLSVFNSLDTKLRSQADESKTVRENEIISLLGAKRVIILPLLLPSFGTAGHSVGVLGYCP